MAAKLKTFKVLGYKDTVSYCLNNEYMSVFSQFITTTNIPCHIVITVNINDTLTYSF